MDFCGKMVKVTAKSSKGAIMENQEKVHKRRVRYSGTHPKNYKEK